MPIFDKIVLSIGILIGIYLFKKTTHVFIKIIFIGFVISFLTIFIDPGVVKAVGYWMFGLLALSFAFYNITKNKILLVIIGIHNFGIFCWGILGFPYYSELYLLTLAPAVAFIIIFIKSKKYINQFSIISIFTGYQIVQLSRLFFTF